jgi:hypothetical protein
MKRVKISARRDHKNRKKRFTHDVTIVIEDEMDEVYEVVDKDFPDDLPDSWIDPDDEKEKKIKWITNFGLKRKADGKFEDKLAKGKKYRIEFPEGLGKLVYFDGKKVKKLPGKMKGKKFQGELDLGDPPIGEGAT